MTKEERLIQSQLRENEKAQRQLSEKILKRDARFKALEVAQYLKPSTNYVNNPLSNQKAVVQDYDIIKKAEEIYKWLIKVLD